MSFVDYLAQEKVITGEEAGRLKKREGDPGNLAVLFLNEEKGLKDQEVLNLKAGYFNIPHAKVDLKNVPTEILKTIPEEAAVHYKFIPLSLDGSTLKVGIVDPENIDAKDALQFIASRLGFSFELYLITEEDFKSLLQNYKGLTGEVHKALGELEDELSKKTAVIKPSAQALKKEGDETKFVEDTPITKIVAVIIRHATEGNASDIHIEHTGEKVRVRFRVDGVLYTSLFLPISVHGAVVARIKVLSKLRLDEKRKPQDGSFAATIDDRKIDFRVSTFPAYYGEKVVLRILDSGKGVKRLEETGLNEEHVKILRASLERPYGLILITGPTGSGKTTTLYAMLNELDREAHNVVSLEDPVEYNVSGISQSQVRPEIGYTFANGLRSILRQDPDIIMVGEIRDNETAQLAIHAALTGHLVFSTLHTNNAAGVIPRLVDMGVDPYLIAPTLILTIAQRLIKMICPTSKKPISIEGAVKAMIEKQFGDLPAQFKKDLSKYTSVYDAVPSSECPGGTKGRTGVYEIIQIDKAMEKVILENPTENAILSAARKQGMLTMKEDALMKSLQGLIPFYSINEFE